MADKVEYVSSLDLKGNEIKQFVAENMQSAPGADDLGKSGRLVSYQGDLYISDGSEFHVLGRSVDTGSLTSRMEEVEAKNTAQDSEIAGLDVRVTSAEAEIDAIKAISGDQSTELIQQVNANKANIELKATKVSTGTGIWTGAITVNEEGIVTAGANLTADDIPQIPASKVIGLPASQIQRFMNSYTDIGEDSLIVNHALNREWPQVTVYDTVSREQVYAKIIYIDSNKVQVIGNSALGSITVVVS